MRLPKEEIEGNGGVVELWARKMDYFSKTPEFGTW